MDDLTYTLRQLCQRNRDGSHTTQRDRLRLLTLMARQLRELGFRQLRATSLNGKHVAALLSRWEAEGLAVSTIKNRMTDLRWWAQKVGKAGLIPADNAELGIQNRHFVTNENKARALSDALEKITDRHVYMSLLVQRRSACGAKKPSSSSRAMQTEAITSCSRAHGRRVAANAWCRSRHPSSDQFSTGRTGWPALDR